MAATPATPPSLQTVSNEKNLLIKSFADLEAHRAAIARCSEGWQLMEQHFAEIELALEKKHRAVLEKEKDFEARVKEREQALDKREGAIESREEASLARVQEQKESAISAIREQRRKWMEERNITETDAMVVESEGNAKAEKKEEGNAKTEKKEEVNAEAERKEEVTEIKKKKVNGTLSLQAQPQAKETKEVKSKSDAVHQNNDGTDKADDSKMGDDGKNKNEDVKEDHPKENSEKVEAEAPAKGKDEAGTKEARSNKMVEARPELKAVCEKMDGLGLRDYLVQHKKDMNGLRKELHSALKCAADPVAMVLKVVEEYQPSEQGSGGKKGGNSASRKACLHILEALGSLLQEDHVTLPPKTRESVRDLANAWRSKLKPESTDVFALADIHSFLQLIATFGLASEYEKDDLCSLMVCIGGRKQIPGLCRALEFTSNVSDLVEQLIKRSKRLEAVSLIHEFELTEKFPPVPLLKAHVKDAKKASQAIAKSSSDDKGDHITKELVAAKAVLNCISQYKLESKYPTEGLQKRVAQLEKMKSEKKMASEPTPAPSAPSSNVDKKRSADAITLTSKKPRAAVAAGASHGAGEYFKPSERPQFLGVERRDFGGERSQFPMGERREFGGPERVHFGGASAAYGVPNRNYGVGGGRDAYPYPPGGMPSMYGHPSFPYANYPYGARPPPGYQGPYMR